MYYSTIAENSGKMYGFVCLRTFDAKVALFSIWCNSRD